MTRMINLWIVLMMIFSVGCQKKQKSNRISTGKTLTLNLQEGDPPTFNPYVGVDLRSRCLFLALYEPLMRKNAEGGLEFAAAEDVDLDPTKTIYTFHIRPHKWSNGEPVTSYHFAKAWKYALSPVSHCIRVDLFYPIKNAQKAKKGEVPLDEVKIFTPDEQTLVIELERPTPYFLELTATSFYSPIYEASDKEPLYFNGPFLVKNRVHEQSLTFRKNPYYWDTDTVDLEEIYFTIVQDPMTALSMYEKGELDLVGDPFSSLPLDVIPDFNRSGKLRSKTISRIFYLLLNNNDPVLQNKSLRKALSFSLDRNLITQHLFFGEDPTLSLLPRPLSNLSTEDLAIYQEDPKIYFEMALEELKLTKKSFPKLTLSYAQLSGQKKLVEYIQESWKEQLGIEIEIECSEWNVHAANLRRKNFQIGTLHLTTLYQDPMFFLELYKDKEDFCNYCAWENPNYRSLLSELGEENDPDRRMQKIKIAERYLIEQMPVIPLFTQNLQFLVNDDIDLKISDLGVYDFKSSRIRTKAEI